MKTFMTVLYYTIQENLRKKLFIVSTVVILILTIGVISIPAIVEKVSESKASNTNTQADIFIQDVYVIDPGNLLDDDAEALAAQTNGHKFFFAKEADLEKLKEKVKTDPNGNPTLVVFTEKDGVPFIEFWVKNAGNGSERHMLTTAIRKVYASNLLAKYGVDQVTHRKVLSNVGTDVNELGKGMASGFVASYMVSLLLFFAIYMYGYGVAMSVASEKTSRVMELLITSARPSRIILGKTAAMGVLGLIQMLIIIGAAAATYALTFPENFTIAGMRVDLSAFTPYAIFVLVVYFILGYILYALLNAVAGASVSRAEDINSAIMPISMITMIAFYFAYATMTMPGSSMAVVASIVPLSSPFCMPCRILTSEVPIWQVLASVGGLFVFIAAAGWISIRIYSSAVLHYGKRLKLKDMMGMTRG